MAEEFNLSIYNDVYDMSFNQETEEIHIELKEGYYPLSNNVDLSNCYTKPQSDSRYKSINYVPTWSEISGKPTTFTPSAHTHTISEVINLQSTLDNKEDKLNAVNLGEILDTQLSIKMTPSADDEIVILDSITGDAATVKFSSFGGNVDTSNLVPYDNANKDVNIGAFYYESSAGFKKTGGTSSQYLMADGSTSTLPTDLIRGTGTTNYIPKFSASGTIGNSIIYENNNSISIGDTVSDARLRVKAQGSNAADIVLRVRNSANTRDFLVVNGTGDVYNKGAQGVASNTFFGENVGRNTTGGNNTALGYNAFSSNTLGIGNSAFGDYALSANTSGTGNSAFGNYSLSANTTGENNTAFGGNTLSSNISGVYNSAFGEAALWANTTGGDNSAFGDHALSENTTGKNNIAIGSSAGRSISDDTPLINATSSVFVGCNTKSSKNGNTNEIVIGQSAIGNGSNTATIGNDSTTDVYLKGITNSNGFKTPTGTPNQALTADGGTFDLNTKLSVESQTTTGTAISFIIDKVYGTLTTPETGNITADVTNAKLGVTNIIIHNSGTAPTFGSGFKKLSGSGNYVTGVVNYIYCTFISNTEIIYSINQRT